MGIEPYCNIYRKLSKSSYHYIPVMQIICLSKEKCYIKTKHIFICYLLPWNSLQVILIDMKVDCYNKLQVKLNNKFVVLFPSTHLR